MQSPFLKNQRALTCGHTQTLVVTTKAMAFINNVQNSCWSLSDLKKAQQAWLACCEDCWLPVLQNFSLLLLLSHSLPVPLCVLFVALKLLFYLKFNANGADGQGLSTSNCLQGYHRHCRYAKADEFGINIPFQRLRAVNGLRSRRFGSENEVICSQEDKEAFAEHAWKFSSREIQCNWWKNSRI